MLKIHGPQQELTGTVSTSGSKNASLPIIAASLLIPHVTLHNVPRIGDIFSFLEIIGSLGVAHTFEGNTLTFDTTGLSTAGMRTDLVKKIRASILLLAPVLNRVGSITLPYPGGCNIGKRPIDEHIHGLEAIGYQTRSSEESIELHGTAKEGNVTVSAGFAVTATENIISANVLRKGTTTIELAAIEPHVMDLIAFLRSAGANIEVLHDHTILVHGVDALSERAEHSIIHDYIEAGTFVVLAALTAKDHIDIRNARIRDLRSFLGKCREVGVQYEDIGNDTLRVFRSTENLKAIKRVQTNVFPGFPTDLQSIFAILLTQAEGISRIEEIMFEGRLNFLVEIEKMKGHPALLNPHEALIFGSTKLRGATVSSWDLRAGVAMIIAGLIAHGETSITNVEYIERGYEDIIGKLAGLGAKIEKLSTLS